jgi:ACT domain
VALISLRVSMPDRPGMLAAVASAVSETGCDIVTIDVVSRAEGLVVDDLCVETGSATPPALRRRVEEIPGLVVEFVRSVDMPPPAVVTLELAWALVDNTLDRVGVLVHGLPGALHAEWAMALELNDGAVHLLDASSGAPPPPCGTVPWLPIEAPRRLAVAPWMPTSWRLRAVVGGLEIAVSPLGHPKKAVVVARNGGRFRPPELRQIQILAALTVRGPHEIALRPPPVLKW